VVVRIVAAPGKRHIHILHAQDFFSQISINGEGMPLAPIIFGAPFNLEIGLGHRTVDIKTGI